MMITKEEVFLIHDEVVKLHGGANGIRDIGGLESAIARPLKLLQKQVYTQLVLKKLQRLGKV